MFKKHEVEPPKEPVPEPKMGRPLVETERPAPAPKAPPKAPPRERAVIGPSISIRGDVMGEEDLVIDGRVEGTVELKHNSVTVGKEGRIKANIRAKVVEVQGRVEGDLRGDEQVVIRRSGHVMGDITAPRVSLEDGCKYRGRIEMDGGSAAAPETGKGKVSDFKPAPSAPATSQTVLSARVDQKISGT
ncbi:MAG: polymer-forming cytoskeletal protein [Gammaproteobacteria bacterium]|nr:polymer-forming cytoskeletal protein [Gammaproteobacteria bacterium]NIR84777.1 polymer-forming cytoskeletal protein [Gammaproteobacteria bacterium]NIR91296.1 polymer-forming cytoskeletal protein [Gammaproteobacteria bacterium]NIU05824.1 polymer-forming cytoskeletal protein [Gammaproteobacteria bacterium]NIV76484.1 polymer-forming cytoskeletal protein [Gammaproteobacteria bacterium]